MQYVDAFHGRNLSVISDRSDAQYTHSAWSIAFWDSSMQMTIVSSLATCCACRAGTFLLRNMGIGPPTDRWPCSLDQLEHQHPPQGVAHEGREFGILDNLGGIRSAFNVRHLAVSNMIK